jgi:hypothetical protein
VWIFVVGTALPSGGSHNGCDSTLFLFAASLVAEQPGKNRLESVGGPTRSIASADSLGVLPSPAHSQTLDKQ